jgi:hypothetical protein
LPPEKEHAEEGEEVEKASLRLLMTAHNPVSFIPAFKYGSI